MHTITNFFISIFVSLLLVISLTQFTPKSTHISSETPDISEDKIVIFSPQNQDILSKVEAQLSLQEVEKERKTVESIFDIYRQINQEKTHKNYNKLLTYLKNKNLISQNSLTNYVPTIYINNAAVDIEYFTFDSGGYIIKISNVSATQCQYIESFFSNKNIEFSFNKNSMNSRYNNIECDNRAVIQLFKYD